MPTQESLWPIYRIQGVEGKIAAVQRARAALDDGSALGREAVQCRSETEALAEAAQKADAAVREAEMELASVEEKAKRIQGILYSGKVVNPKELQGYEGELASLRRRKDTLEERVLMLMEERDGVAARLTAAQGVEAKARSRWKKKVLAFREQTAALDAEKAGLDAELEALRAAADPALVRAHDIALRSRKTLVGHLEEDICSACGMLLQGRMAKEYKSRLNAEMDCPTCGAHLLWRVPKEDA